MDEATGLTDWVRLGDGSTDWATQLSALQDEPVGTLTVETHWHPEDQDGETDTRQVYAALRRVLAEVTPADEAPGAAPAT